MAVEVAAAWIGALAAMIAAGLSWWGQRSAASESTKASQYAAIVSAKAELATNDKTVFVGSVTAERASWRSEMRTETSSLVGLLRTSGEGIAIEWPTVFKQVSELALRLNPLGRSGNQTEQDRHPLDRDIHLILSEILRSTRDPKPEHHDLATHLEKAVALLLKQEWKVSKDEAQSGKLKQPTTAL